MTRDEINQTIARAAGVDIAPAERVLVGLERVIQAELSKGGNKFGRIMALYQNWKTGS